MTLRPLIAAAAPALFLAAPAAASEFTPLLEDLAASELEAILTDPALIAAIRAQNAETGTLTPAEIEALDAQWRREVDATDRPLIDRTTSGPAAEVLKAARETHAGLFTEIFVMDARGLNVAASDTTSDYWQGDEAKWQQTFPAGPDALHIGEVEFDESTQTYQSQISVPVTDPDTQAVIGAATFGVNLELLQ